MLQVQNRTGINADAEDLCASAPMIFQNRPRFPMPRHLGSVLGTSCYIHPMLLQPEQVAIFAIQLHRLRPASPHPNSILQPDIDAAR